MDSCSSPVSLQCSGLGISTVVVGRVHCGLSLVGSSVSRNEGVWVLLEARELKVTVVKEEPKIGVFLMRFWGGASVS